MCKNSFPLLKNTDIECRVAQAGLGKNGPWASILLYKDARVDQRIMDETFGPMNWQAEYETIDGKLFCKVSVWDSEKGCWISKMNVGTESNTEADKGLVSDCLKRACFTWGLGVELYSAPKIFVNLQEGEYSVDNHNGKSTVKTALKLLVDAIEYNSDRKVSYLSLKDKKGIVRYTFGSRGQNSPETAKNQNFPTASPVKYVARDGKTTMVKGGKRWQALAERAAYGESLEDGTPLPVYIADFFNIPDADMKEFCTLVEEIANNNN